MEGSKYVMVPIEVGDLEDEKSCPVFEPLSREPPAGLSWHRAKEGMGSKLVPWSCAFILALLCISFYTADPYRPGNLLLRQVSQLVNWTRLTAEKAEMERYGAVRDPSELASMPFWVMSLKRAKDRRENVRKQMDARNMSYSFVDAIDGVKEPISPVELELFAGYRAQKYKEGSVYHQRKVAADVTNWRLMHRMLAGKVPMALLMEDDFVLPDGSFMDRLNATMANLPADWDVFALNACSMRKHGRSLGGFVGEGVRVFKSGSCTLCLVIRLGAVPKVLKMAERRLRYQNWDTIVLGLMAQTGDLNTYIADPPMCLFSNQLPSIIEPERAPFADILKP